MTRKSVKVRKKPGPLAKSDKRYRFAICKWIALGFSTKHIRAKLEDEFGIEMNSSSIDETYRYGRRWRMVIGQIRKRYLKNISRLEITKKAWRLAMLQEAIFEALTFRTKTITKDGNVIEEKKIGVIPALIQQARAEVEGEEKAVVSNSYTFASLTEEKVKSMTREELLRDINARLCMQGHRAR